MLFTFEQEEGDGESLFADGIGHLFGLVGGDDPVFETLEEDDGTGETVGVMDGGPCEVEVATVGIGTDEAVEIAGFEFVGVGGEGFEVGDAEVRGTGFEDVFEGERGESGVTSGGAAIDGESVGIDLSGACEVECAVGAVVDIDDSPVVAEAVAIGSSVAGASTIVDVEDGVAAGGPELRGEAEGGGGGGN